MTFLHRERRATVALLAALALLTAGCSDMLDENPLSSVTPVNFYDNPSDALTALTAVYSSFRYVGQSVNWNYMINDATPEMVNRRDRTNSGGCWDVFACTASNPATTNFWNDSYAGINRANAVIDNVPKIEGMDPALQARIVAEARFLRAMHYFGLVRLFGGVPLFDHETTSLKELVRPRSTADEIYAFVIADLQAAIPDLPLSVPAAEFGRATQGAAHTLLGNVYLQRGTIGSSNPFGDPLYWPTADPSDLKNAGTELRAVVESGQYALVDDYASLWRPATEINSEVVFSVRFAPFEGQGAQMCTYDAPLNSDFCFRQFASEWGEVPFVESYAPGDVRKEGTWILEFDGPDGVHRVFDAENVMGDNYGREGPAPYKLIGDVRGMPSTNTEPVDFLMYRYADVLLMLAEAEWRQDPGSAEALSLVNQVRARAHVAPLPALTEKALYWERSWELATEQKARYDAPRFWALYLENMETSAGMRTTNPEKYGQGQPVPPSMPEVEEPKVLLVAIPQGAIDVNPKLVQNPGW
jgi:hypothetical protein